MRDQKQRTSHFTRLKPLGLPALLVFFNLAVASGVWGQSATRDWKGVEEILGQKGMERGGLFEVRLFRTDLNVVVEGVPLEPEGALVSRFVFKPLAHGAQMTGKILLLDSEVPKATAQALKNGLEIKALYDPFLNESPALKCLVVEGQGAKASLAWAAKYILSSTDTPVGPGSQGADPIPSPAASPKPADGSKIQDSLGIGSLKGRTLQFDFPEDPAAPSEEGAFILFQRSGMDCAAYGEWVVPSGAEKGIMEIFSRHHIVLTSFHRQELGGGKPLSILDFWIKGSEGKVAEGLKEALDQADLLPAP